VLWLQPHTPNRWVLIGAVGVLVAMILVGCGKTAVAGHGTDAQWKWLVLGGGLLSGVSFMTQAYMGVRQPGFRASLLYCVTGYATAAVILFWAAVWGRVALWRPREMAGGVIIGIGYAAFMPLTLYSFRYFPAEIVLPVTVVSPMVLTLLLGTLVYREHLSATVWCGCLLAALAVAVLAFGA